MAVAQKIQTLKPWLGLTLMGWLLFLPLTAIAVEFRPPRRSIPGRREGAGTRGPDCVRGTPNLTVLLPPTNIGLTTAAYPKFFWFVPQTRAKSMEFVLFRGTEQDPEQELIYETSLEIANSPGIASVALPNQANIPPLTVGQDYYWSVTIVCDADDPSRNIQADGWIQRIAVDPALARQLRTTKPGDRPQLYAQNGLWFDALSALADLRCLRTHAATPDPDWASLLRSVQLDRIAEQPLQQSCR